MYLTTDRDSVEPQRVIASSKFGVSICNWCIPLNPLVGTIYIYIVVRWVQKKLQFPVSIHTAPLLPFFIQTAGGGGGGKESGVHGGALKNR